MSRSARIAARLRRALDRYRLRLRDRLLKYARVDGGDGAYVFRCESEFELFRANTLLEKEPGTVEWIRTHVRPGDVFCDVGANVGMYSLIAARSAGAGGKVYAFEPHVPNFHSLLYNIALNNAAGVITPLSAALHDSEGVLPFNYFSWTAGSSMSQLGGTVDGEETEFRPVIAELKVAVTLDRLVRDGAVRSPDHIKIDVDGNELQVLRGMTEVLTGPSRPRSLQIEINARHRADLFAFLADCGFEVYHRHYTQLGAKAVAAGKDPEEVAHNALFRPRAAAVRAA